MTDSTITATIAATEASHLTLIRAHWKLVLVRGIILVIVGFLAAALPFAATLATELLIGWLFVIGGMFRAIALATHHRLPGFWQSLFIDLLMVALGILLVVHPLSGELTLAMLVAAFFIFEAFTDFYVALHYHHHAASSGWLVLSGIASIVIAVFIFAGWPGTAAWAVGLLVGINLMFRGLAIIMTALAVRMPGVANEAGAG
jgi:uncharacterized membrane protein HdeD (DUF308 family)